MTPHDTSAASGQGLGTLRPRVQRPGQWFWLDRALLVDQYGAQLGAGCIALYTVLARYADHRTGECWPSIRTLQRHLGWSRNTVRKYLRQLQAAGLLHARPCLRRVAGKTWQGSLFTLLTPPSPDQRRPAWVRALSYAAYLTTAHWAQVRTKALRWAQHRCQLCNGQGPLHVHHRTYAHLGDELRHMADVLVLCDACHAKHHDILPPPPVSLGEDAVPAAPPAGEDTAEPPVC
jgi:5-methylcytosine-specific restriction endonuclease McrA